MQKFCSIIIAFFVIFIGITSSAFAGEYKVIVIPNSFIDCSAQKSLVEKVSIEEILTNKIIYQLESSGLACAPTPDILKVAILNNPYVSKDAPALENAKAISDSYNVSKVIIVESNLVLQNTSQQKEVWNKFNLPVISQTDDCYQVVTTVTMYDMKTKEALWNDVCFHKLCRASEGINSVKLSSLTSYYDSLIGHFIKDLKTIASTSAVVVNNKKPEAKQTEKTTILQKINTVKNTNNKEQQVKTNVVKTTTPTTKTVQQKPTPAVTQKESTQQSFTSKMSDSLKNTKNKIHNYLEEKETERAIREIKEQEQREIQQAIKSNEKPKEVKEQPTMTDRVKEKYNAMKQNYEAKKEESIKSDQEAQYYTNISSPDSDGVPQVNNYIQMKPRNNSRNYTPKFDSSVNDI